MGSLIKLFMWYVLTCFKSYSMLITHYNNKYSDKTHSRAYRNLRVSLALEIFMLEFLTKIRQSISWIKDFPIN